MYGDSLNLLYMNRVKPVVHLSGEARGSHGPGQQTGRDSILSTHTHSQWGAQLVFKCKRIWPLASLAFKAWVGKWSHSNPVHPPFKCKLWGGGEEVSRADPAAGHLPFKCERTQGPSLRERVNGAANLPASTSKVGTWLWSLL